MKALCLVRMKAACRFDTEDSEILADLAGLGSAEAGLVLSIRISAVRCDYELAHVNVTTSMEYNEIFEVVDKIALVVDNAV